MTGNDPFGLAVDRSALKALKSIGKGQPKIARRIAENIQALRDDPAPGSSRQLASRLLEGQPIRRLRVGSYRVLYLVDTMQREIRVLDIGHRREVYRDLS